MEEREIERLAKTMGEGAAGRLDVERVTATVLARLRTDRVAAQRPARVWWRPATVLRVAAALAVLIAGGALARGLLESRPDGAAVAPMLRDLSTEELTEVFDSLSIEAPVHDGVAIGLENLSAAQLQELLRLMEG